MTDDTQHVNIVDWNDRQWEEFKTFLEAKLLTEVVEIIFKKIDGTERTMQATKKSSLISRAMERKLVLDLNIPAAPAKIKRQRKAPPDKLNITVWDVDKEDWRTIKIKTIQNVLTLILKYDYKPSKPFFDLDIFN